MSCSAVTVLGSQSVPADSLSLAGDFSHRNSVIALHQDECLLGVRKLRGLHRSLPQPGNQGGNSSQKRSSLRSQITSIERRRMLWYIASYPRTMEQLRTIVLGSLAIG